MEFGFGFQGGFTGVTDLDRDSTLPFASVLAPASVMGDSTCSLERLLLSACIICYILSLYAEHRR